MVSRIRASFVAAEKPKRSKVMWLLVPAFLTVGFLGGTFIANLPAVDWKSLVAQPEKPANLTKFSTRQFPICGGGARVDCVVDGDTFWMDGVKIRIADIDTPEISQPQCGAEAALGHAAKDRLRELLNAGPFDLAQADRDEDRYGRKLRIVQRDGKSLGTILVAEGLAHVWGGAQRSWC
jgi:micrococcal nuclease